MLIQLNFHLRVPQIANPSPAASTLPEKKSGFLLFPNPLHFGIASHG